MRILHCIPTLAEGGSELQLAVLAGAQARAGDDVHVAVSREGAWAAGLGDRGVRVHSLRPLGNHDPTLFPRLLGLVQRLGPDILQTWLRQMDIVGGLVARRTRTAWVLAERSGAGAHRGGWKSALRTRLAQRADGIVSNSREGDAYWAARVGPAVRRFVIGNAVALDEIAAAPAAEPEPGRAIVVSVGRLSSEKNLPTLLRAVRLASARPLHVDVCGVGSEEAALQRLAAEEGLSEVVRFRGFLNPVWSLLKRADVFVSVSLYEGQPNAVLEAMAAGCPLVLSDIPAHRELVGENGALFADPSSPGAVAAAIERCLARRDEAAERARVARAGLSVHSADEAARRYRRVYEEVLGGRAGGRTRSVTPCAG